jgi:selenocysteine-specific elongation factor
LDVLIGKSKYVNIELISVHVDIQVKRIIQKIQKALSNTRFGSAPFVVLSAAPGGAGKLGAAAPLESGSKTQADTVKDLVDMMKKCTTTPRRSADGPFYFAADHCFPIKGQGTVLTGTVLSGSCDVNDLVELPSLKIEKKVKSMQVFKQSVHRVKQGDRAGICVAGLDPSAVERDILCASGTGM